HGLLSQSLQLVHACLTYDFIGTSAGTGNSICDESSNGMDDLMVIQIPTSWRSIFLDSDTVRLFFRLYSGLPADLRSLVLSCLVQLVSVRRSLFTNTERQSFLAELVGGTRTILANQSVSLSDSDTYHEFCRLLSRLKCNFQLTELIGLDCHAEFIHLITGFTIHSLKSFLRGTNNNSIHYLLALWQRLVASLPYVQSPESELIENAASQISRTYIEACLASIPDYVNCPSNVRSTPEKSNKPDGQSWTSAGFHGSRGTTTGSSRHPGRSKPNRGDSLVQNDNDDDGSSECPLDDLTTLSQQMEQFAVIGRCGFARTCELVAHLFDESAGSYEKALSMLSQPSVADPSLIQIINYEEHRLSWLVYMAGALIGSRVNYTSADDDCGGDLVYRVLQLMRLTANRLTLSASTTSPTNLTTSSAGASRLEMASLSFFEQFRRIYASESVGRMARVYLRLSEVLGFSDDLPVLGAFVEKILTNLKYWTCQEPILRRTLDLLSELSRGYSAMRKLLRLDGIQFILANHTEDNFPFLAPISDVSGIPTHAQTSRYRLRTSFYASLARLLMVDLGEDETRFLNFMAPLTRVANRLIMTILSGFVFIELTLFGSIASNMMTAEQAKNAVIGLARDLRGLSSSLNTKGAYQLLLEWFYPTGFKLFGRALELWPLDPMVSVSVLKLLAEIVHNRNGRLLFDSTVPTGYLLFTELSTALSGFGIQIIPHTRDVPKQSIYSVKLKPVMAALRALKMYISGNFINFGVFSLFRDDSLEKCMQMGVQLMLSIDESDLQVSETGCLFVVYDHMATYDFLPHMHVWTNPFFNGRRPTYVHFIFRRLSPTKSIRLCSTLLLFNAQEYPKVALAYFELLEYMVNDHLTFVASLGEPVLLHFLNTIANNISSIDTAISDNCCLCLDYVLTHLFKLVQQQQRSGLMNGSMHSGPDTELHLISLDSINSDTITGQGSSLINKHQGASRFAVWSARAAVAENQLLDLLKPNSTSLLLLRRMLVVLLCSVVQEECRNQWSISRPLLTLIFLNNEYYIELRNQVIASMPADRQETMTKLFDKLMDEVEFSLIGKDRDKFTQNVSSFKHALSEFMKTSNGSASARHTENSAMQDQTMGAEATNPTVLSVDTTDSEYICLSATIAQAAGLGHIL
ncbi:XPO7, partial [Fasciolopsis buskii]